ncbi:MAG TPA: glycosyl hydrolase family 28-related protein [Cytophagaceae bacterium]|jgi:hypothetical protein|nr:glycosyl hydrolase family 28-related protein [Cytophagaceae bacterium]
MKKNMLPKVFVIMISSLLMNHFSTAQNLSASRSIDWSANLGVIGGIPTITTVHNVTETTPALIGDGETDNTTNLQALLNNTTAYPSPCVFYFPQGKYLFTNSISMVAGRVIRGDCAANTCLSFKLGVNDAPCFGSNVYNYGALINITGGTTKGSTAITLSSTASFSVGSWVEIYQSNECNVGDLMYTLNPSNGCTISWAADAIGQLFKVTAISGDTLKIDRPLRFSFYTPSGGTLQARTIEMIENVGFENFRIVKTDTGTVTNNNTYTFQFESTANSWIRCVQSDSTYKGHAWVERSANMEFHDNYFNDSYVFGGSGEGYGVMLGQHVGNCLVENNVFNHLRHAMLAKQGASGNVYAYNFGTNAYWTGSTGIPPHINLHGQYPFENLFESNVVQRITLADYWGPSGPGNTFLRNRVTESNFAVQDNSNNENIIGTELTGGSNTITVSGFGASVANSTGTYLLSNNINGILMNDSSSYGINAQNSFYLTSAPSFYTSAGINWPSIGPGNLFNSGQIPAQQRFLAGTPLASSCACSTSTVLSVKTSSLNNNLFQNIKIYPSPFSDESGLTIVLNSPQIASLAISDLNGNKIYSNSSYISGTTILKNASLTQGIYLLRINIQGEVQNFKLIKI